MSDDNIAKDHQMATHKTKAEQEQAIKDAKTARQKRLLRELKSHNRDPVTSHAGSANVATRSATLPSTGITRHSKRARPESAIATQGPQPLKGKGKKSNESDSRPVGKGTIRQELTVDAASVGLDADATQQDQGSQRPAVSESKEEDEDQEGPVVEDPVHEEGTRLPRRSNRKKKSDTTRKVPFIDTASDGRKSEVEQNEQQEQSRGMNQSNRQTDEQEGPPVKTPIHTGRATRGGALSAAAQRLQLKKGTRGSTNATGWSQSPKGTGKKTEPSSKSAVKTTTQRAKGKDRGGKEVKVDVPSHAEQAGRNGMSGGAENEHEAGASLAQRNLNQHEHLREDRPEENSQTTRRRTTRSQSQAQRTQEQELGIPPDGERDNNTHNARDDSSGTTETTEVAAPVQQEATTEMQPNAPPGPAVTRNCSSKPISERTRKAYNSQSEAEKPVYWKKVMERDDTPPPFLWRLSMRCELDPTMRMFRTSKRARDGHERISQSKKEGEFRGKKLSFCLEYRKSFNVHSVSSFQCYVLLLPNTRPV